MWSSTRNKIGSSPPPPPPPPAEYSLFVRWWSLSHPQAYPVRQLARITGMLASMGNVLRPVARLQSRSMPNQMQLVSEVSWGASLRLNEDSIRELTFWLREFDNFHNQPIWAQHPQALILVFSDASDSGWGCHCPTDDSLVARREWRSDRRLASTSSTKRELHGALLAIQSLSSQLSGRGYASARTTRMWFVFSSTAAALKIYTATRLLFFPCVVISTFA